MDAVAPVATESVDILLVDDNPLNLDALAAVLDPAAYRLVRAHSAQEALLALLDGEFAAIVLDIEMPGLNGIELARLIKQRKRTRDIPILFLTAFHVDESDVLQGYTAGAVDYLSKPLHPDILRFKVAVFAELFRRSRALAAANAALSREVSERVQAQQKLHEANERLERRVRERTLELLEAVDNERMAREEAERQGRLKESFLTVVSHELRTPLNAIYGWCRVLARPGLDASTLAQGLAVIERNALGQARLIEDLLDVSSIDAGRARLQLQPVDVGEIARSAALAIAPVAAAAGVAFSFDEGFDGLGPVERRVHGDPSRLQQVVGNLLQNAMKFTPRGGRVELGLRRGEGAVEVFVADTGEGIDPSFVPQLFEKFRQADESTSRRHGGLGLGLSIVRQLVQLHGGRVGAHSAGPGLGATFTVSLPLAAPDAPPPAAADASPPAAAPGTDGPAVPDASGGDPAAGDALAGVRVLLVDDEPDALDVARRLLEREGATVAIATSVDETFERLGSGPCDALVADIGMAGRDGYALIAEVRRRERPGERLPAVALTAFARPEDRRRALLHGFDEHVVKPIGLATLAEVVARLLRHDAPATGTGAIGAATAGSPAVP